MSGKPVTAVSISALAFPLSIAVIWGLTSLPGLAAIVIAIALLLTLYVGVSVHAWRTARKPSNVTRPGRALLGAALLAMLAAGSLASDREKAWFNRNHAEGFRIPSATMEPTIRVGDYVFVAPRKSRPIVRDGLYTFHSRDVLFLKRAVGLPGDTLEMRKGVLIRNGSPVQEPYAQFRGAGYDDARLFAWQAAYLTGAVRAGAYRPTVDDWGPLVVAESSVFFLGDNRHESRDSRYDGFVPDSAVVGQPARIYFSRSADDGIRWDRIGRKFEPAAY